MVDAGVRQEWRNSFLTFLHLSPRASATGLNLLCRWEIWGDEVRGMGWKTHKWCNFFPNLGNWFSGKWPTMSRFSPRPRLTRDDFSSTGSYPVTLSEFEKAYQELSIQSLIFRPLLPNFLKGILLSIRNMEKKMSSSFSLSCTGFHNLATGGPLWFFFPSFDDQQEASKSFNLKQ